MEYQNNIIILARRAKQQSVRIYTAIQSVLKPKINQIYIMGGSSAEEKESATPSFQNLILYFFLFLVYARGRRLPNPSKISIYYANILNIPLEKKIRNQPMLILYIIDFKFECLLVQYMSIQISLNFYLNCVNK